MEENKKKETNHFTITATIDPPTEWMNEMNVDGLEEGADQPFYKIFVDDGSCQYAAQENLLLAPNPEWINHHAIGRYFEIKYTND